jgi:DNA processing protein
MYRIAKISPDNEIYLQMVNFCLAKPLKSLWYIGKLPESRMTSVAIVGTRKPTPYGRELTYNLSYSLAKRGGVIISGLALGIDGIAHQAALDAGGTTIAVLPTSLTRIHPQRHRDLAKNIIDSGGAIITEYSPDDGVFKANFLARNRIVAAMSDGVLITEAAARSGTLATAAFALEQGKPVMAVPGNVTSVMSAGCNKLIKQGARLVTEAEDIYDELGLSPTAQRTLGLAASDEEAIIMKLLNIGVRDGDELQKQSGLEPALFSQTLTMLEIDDKIRALGANQWGMK